MDKRHKAKHADASDPTEEVGEEISGISAQYDQPRPIREEAKIHGRNRRARIRAKL